MRLKFLSKRELYKIAFPDRLDSYSTKHYSRMSKPKLLQIIEQRSNNAKASE